MTIDKDFLNNLRERLRTIIDMIIMDARTGSEAAAAAHWYIMDADETMQAWYDSTFTEREFAKVCGELDKAVDALTKYSEDITTMLIVIRYSLERAPQRTDDTGGAGAFWREFLPR